MACIEIAVQDVAGARIARAAGADRIELCSALLTGGLTPSMGLIQGCVAAGIDVAVLIRPRPGDFQLTGEDIATSNEDIKHAIRAGARAVVVGALDGPRLNSRVLRQWRDTAHALDASVDIVIHRCVDVLLGNGMPAAALVDDIAAIGGITRVLTSGGAATCREGASTLNALARAAAPAGITILAGGGLKPCDIPALRGFGVTDFHLSARRSITGGPTGPGGGASSYDATDEAIVREAVAVARCG